MTRRHAGQLPGQAVSLTERHRQLGPQYPLSPFGLDWFCFWLQDYEDPDLAKREQYARWREMKATKDKPSSITAPTAGN